MYASVYTDVTKQCTAETARVKKYLYICTYISKYIYLHIELYVNIFINNNTIFYSGWQLGSDQFKALACVKHCWKKPIHF